MLLLQISTVSLLAERANAGNMSAFRALRTLRALRPLKAVSRWGGMRVLSINLINAKGHISLFIAQINMTHYSDNFSMLKTINQRPITWQYTFLI